ncbi:MAG TPA: NlpC/P60 family protein [Streptosporangiaceae bacterium]
MPAAISVLVVGGTAAGVVLAAAGGAPPGSAGSGLSAAAGSAMPSGLPSRRTAPVRSNKPVVPLLGGPRNAALSVTVAKQMPAAPQPTQSARPTRVAPLRGLRQADLLIVASKSLPAKFLAQVARQPGVTSTEPLEAARVKVNGQYAAVLGVDASSFRSYAAKSTASSDSLWQGVADGDVAVSYSMGKLDKLPLGGRVTIAGRATEHLPVVAFGTVGIAGVDAVVSDSVAKSLGMPAANATVISAAPEDVAALTASIRAFAPRGVAVEPLVTWVVSQSGGTASAIGAPGSVAPPSPVGSGSANGSALNQAQLSTVLQAALSRRGMPYIWGAAGPSAFDCSGLVEWSFAQAGIAMPRVAADQALAGPAVPVSRLAAGDLLFYHTDPTDPGYISHVALYLGNGWMIQAPQPGMSVEVVPVELGSEFAGAIQVNPRVAAQEATGIAG